MGKKKKETINKKDNSKIVNTCIIIGIVFLIGSLVLMFTDNGKKSYIKSISYGEYVDKIKEDKYTVMLLTSPTCSHCVNYKPSVNYVAGENNLEVYDINLNNLSLEEYNAIHNKYSAIKDEFDNNGNPVIPTPVTIIVKNGEEVASTLGEIGTEGFKRFLKNNNVIKAD